MYCSACGVAVTQSLTYCNHCGAKLGGEKVDSLIKTTELRADSLVISAMVGLFVLGLVAISILMFVMKEVTRFEFGPIVAFVTLSFLILFSLEGVLVSRLFRRKRGADLSGNESLSKRSATTKELEAQSRDFTEPISSVTDHTTRAFDPVFIERK